MTMEVGIYKAHKNTGAWKYSKFKNCSPNLSGPTCLLIHWYFTKTPHIFFVFKEYFVDAQGKNFNFDGRKVKV